MKRSASKKHISPLKAVQARAKARHIKARDALHKANETKKTLKIRLNELKADFKHKLATAAETAYHRAHAELHAEQHKKHEAKMKILSAAEAKFEKSYAKKTAKKSKRKIGKTHHAAHPHTTNLGNVVAVKKAKHHRKVRQMNRGRPAKVI